MLVLCAPRVALSDSEPAIPVAVFVMPPGDAMAPARRATVLLTMEDALAGDARLEVIDRDQQLVARAASQQQHTAAAKAREHLARGEELVRAGRVEAALPRLRQAAARLARLLPLVEPRELARAQLVLAAAHAAAGNAQRATAQLTELLTWRPDTELDSSLVPQALAPRWREAEAAVSELARGSIDIQSQPDGVLAYVDGRFVGFTPTAVEDLAVGTHYVTLRQLGFRRVTMKVEVEAAAPARAAAVLQPAPGAEKLAEALRSIAASGLAAAEGPAELATLASLLGIRHAVFVEVPLQPDEKRYRAVVYDVKSGRRIASATAPVRVELEPVFGELARSLYSELSLAPAATPIVRDRKRGKTQPPIYRRWWFWTGAAAIATVALVPLWFVLDDDGPSCPSGAVCGDVILHRF